MHYRVELGFATEDPNVQVGVVVSLEANGVHNAMDKARGMVEQQLPEVEGWNCVAGQCQEDRKAAQVALLRQTVEEMSTASKPENAES